jgi:tetratricopeptide (TPR) repeat protein
MQRRTALILLAAASTQAFAETPPVKAAAPAKAASPAKPSPTPAPAGGLSSLGQVAEQQKSPQQERLDSAVRLFREEQYAPAAVAFHDLAESPDAAALKETAEYNLAKALYRLKLHHSSLGYFERLLKRGPESRYYRSALEWSLFIARKIVADDRVLDAVAKYTDGKFPDEYKNEFRYLLARHHYVEGIAIESGAEVGNLGEARAEETVTGGLSLKGDVFGGDEGGGDAPKGQGEAEVKKKAGGGLSIEDDIFGSDDEPKKKSNGGKKGKGKGKHEGDTAKPETKQPEPEPAKKPEAKPEPAKKTGAVSAEGLTAKEHFENSALFDPGRALLGLRRQGQVPRGRADVPGEEGERGAGRLQGRGPHDQARIAPRGRLAPAAGLLPAGPRALRRQAAVLLHLLL